MVIWENHLHEQNSQKEPGFWGVLAAIYSKTTFFLEIGFEKSDLQMVIRENHLHEQNSQKEYGIYIYGSWRD